MTRFAVLALLGAMVSTSPAVAETISLRVAKTAIKRDARAPNGATARLLLDPDSTKRLAALADQRSGKLATLAIDGREIERQRVSSAFATGELSLTGIPLSKIGSTVVLLIQGSAHLTIRIDSDTNER